MQFNNIGNDYQETKIILIKFYRILSIIILSKIDITWR